LNNRSLANSIESFSRSGVVWHAELGHSSVCKKMAHVTSGTQAQGIARYVIQGARSMAFFCRFQDNHDSICSNLFCGR
jgi:hypothetical protein